MTLLYLDDFFTLHETGRHPENPERIRSISNEFERRMLTQRCQRPDWSPAAEEYQHLVHTTDYTHAIKEYSNAGGGRIEQDTVVSRRSWDVAQSAAGAACDAVDRVLNGEDKTAFCVIRPPGHHALRGAAMGFCLLNNVAIAARFAIKKHQLDKVLIVDWDVHHGNGTQAIFYDDPQVAFYSIHRWPFYPGTGDRNETGTGAGLGATMNDPIPFEAGRTGFLDAFKASIEAFAQVQQPQLVLISAGFDAHRDDPVGSLGLESDDFGVLTRLVTEVAGGCCGGRVVSLLEGGYDLAALAESASVHLETLLAS